MATGVLLDELLGLHDKPHAAHSPIRRQARCSVCGFHIYAATRAGATYALHWHHYHAHVKPWHHDA